MLFATDSPQRCKRRRLPAGKSTSDDHSAGLLPKPKASTITYRRREFHAV